MLNILVVPYTKAFVVVEFMLVKPWEPELQEPMNMNNQIANQNLLNTWKTTQDINSIGDIIDGTPASFKTKDSWSLFYQAVKSIA